MNFECNIKGDELYRTVGKRHIETAGMSTAKNSGEIATELQRLVLHRCKCGESVSIKIITRQVTLIVSRVDTGAVVFHSKMFLAHHISIGCPIRDGPNVYLTSLKRDSCCPRQVRKSGF